MAVSGSFWVGPNDAKVRGRVRFSGLTADRGVTPSRRSTLDEDPADVGRVALAVPARPRFDPVADLAADEPPVDGSPVHAEELRGIARQ